LINPVQHKLVWRTLLQLLALALPLAAALFLPAFVVIDDPSLSPAERAWAESHLRVLSRALLPTLPAIVLLCLFHSILVSHRIGGPLLRFTQVLAELGRGNLKQRVKLRRNDYLTDEAEAINQTITALALRIERIRQLHRDVSATLPPLGRAIARDETAEAAVLAGKLGTQLDELGLRLAQFDLPDDVTMPPALAPATLERSRPVSPITR
jgi:methyl-accepting chemotaxis protein